MKRLILLPVLYLFFCFSSLAQHSINDYSFVVVPENFEFTSKKDQFQLNSMTKYYLNKSGFNAYFQSELPRVNNCDGLYAEVVSRGSFITTTTVIYLKDCEGAIVYESEEGRSKKKEYRQAYQESLRDAFKSVENLNVSQTAIIEDTSISNVAKAAAKRLNVEDAITEVPTTIEKNEILKKPSTPLSDVTFVKGPELKFTYYIKDNNAYLLRKSKNGYSLYMENEIDPIGLVLIGNMTISKDGKRYKLLGEMAGDVTFQKNGDVYLKNKNNIEVLKFQN